MSATIEILSFYVPSLVLRRLMADPAGRDGRGVERHDAAILFADISGFTLLTERLAAQGSRGAERLSDALNAYFERLIALIEAHGGDVVKMAGDALIATWPATASDPLGSMVARASRCGLAIQATLQDFPVAEGVRLGSKVGIGAGEIASLHVGGERDRWELFLSGDPLIQMGEAEQQARPGDVVLSPRSWSLVRDRSSGDPLERGFVRLRRTRDLPPRPLEPLQADPELSRAVRSFIPGAIRARLDAGQGGWLAELRRLAFSSSTSPCWTSTAPTPGRGPWRSSGSSSPGSTATRGA